MKILYIMRGLPGSGKSTMAQAIAKAETLAGKSVKIASADFYHYDETRNYNFKVENLAAAHEQCRKTCEDAMRHGTDIVILDNTNIKKMDYQIYLYLAEQYKYTVQFVVPETQWAFDPEGCWRRNIHGVPLERIQMMSEKYEV